MDGTLVRDLMRRHMFTFTSVEIKNLDTELGWIDNAIDQSLQTNFVDLASHWFNPCTAVLV